MMLLVTLIIWGWSGTLANAQSGELETEIDNLMKDYEAGETPGGVIGVFRNGEFDFAKAYGTANLVYNIPITTETRFNLGSASKQFTGFALALLEKRGELSLNDPVSNYLPDWPTFDHPVTIRDVLTHSSGYRQAYGMLGLSGWRGRDYLPREEILELVRRQPELEFEPGTKFRYNSTGYVILARIIEEVTGQSFPKWMDQNVFGPLDMNNTVIESEVGDLIPGAATSYGKTENGGYRHMFSNRAIYGAAEVYTTLGDFAKWLDNYDTAELGGPSVRDRMRERLVLAPGDTTEYALGLYVGQFMGLHQVWHGGSHAGFKSFFTYAPNLDIGLLVMSNYDEFPLGPVAAVLGKSLFSKHQESQSDESELETKTVSVDTTMLKQYQGHFKGNNDNIYTIELDGQTLHLTNGRKLLALSDTLFRVEGQSRRFSFHRESDGSVVQATVHSSAGEKTPVHRIEPWNPAAQDLEKFAGRYINDELETIYTLSVRDGQLVAEHRWNGKVKLKPQIAKGAFSGQWLEIKFEQYENGKVPGFHASAGLTSKVWFRRMK